MKYDFESTLDRLGHDAMAVDAVGNDQCRGFAPDPPKEGFDFIPMWVADMNFPTAKSVQDAIIERAKHPAFGYFSASDAYYDAIFYWHRIRKNETNLKREDIGYENGVLGGVISAMKVFAAPGDPVLVHSPTYMGFRNCLLANGYHIVASPLKVDEDGVWRMDYEDMERKIQKYHIHVTIFCNPHNPCGRVWSRDEIAQAMEIFRRNDVWVISDEIWSDLMMNGNRYTPVSSVSEWAREHTCSFYAPSKTFNLAGLIGSYHVIYNKAVRERVQGISGKLVYNSMNVLSEHALIGAYSEEGNDWLCQLLPVLSENVNLAFDTITSKFPGVFTFRTEGTYMMFLDCGEWLRAHHMTQEELLRRGWEYGVGWQDGRLFDRPDAIRLNLALPTRRVKEALRRMEKYIFV